MVRRDVWLVTGGAGYIGGHIVARLHAAGRPVVVYDDLSTGSAHRVPDGVPLICASVLDEEALAKALVQHEVTGVMHVAAKKSVPDSMRDPVLYYRENIGGVVTLLAAMVHTGVKKLVFTSSAAVYGMPSASIITEQTPAEPISPYGYSKLAGERMIADAGRAHDISWLALRYFNAVGAEGDQLADRGGTNLFPVIFRAFAAGKPVAVTGGDFATHDGTGVRDYIHVADLADAHVAAADRLTRGPAAQVLNVGTGKGYSVLDVLAALRKVTGVEVPYAIGPRRDGDPATVIAAVDRVREELGWSAQRDLDQMVASAWSARQATDEGMR
ncbi:UDP-glucose 4-epimerase GalE [Rhizocola hellebori]|uniref:UDP-glucose 4-epimerase n=1 Tax=Rhizocola hellebori TaxID=1392758 RepID=A0A8J3QCL0_9ACTN|nr:UDP-glucose 4-epimerase GalE [Rhizocola hellebori]GIH08160.1 UDP-glucose 4-epimerase GalE [Rhizocola hellebori]